MSVPPSANRYTRRIYNIFVFFDFSFLNFLDNLFINSFINSSINPSAGLIFNVFIYSSLINSAAIISINFKKISFYFFFSRFFSVFFKREDFLFTSI